MTPALVAPVALCGAVAVAGRFASRRLPPAVATWVLTAGLGVAAVSVVLAASAGAARFAHHLVVTVPTVGWTRAVASAETHGVHPAVGILSWAVLAAVAVSVGRSVVRDRRTITDVARSVRRLRASDVPLAFAVPDRRGRPGRVVVSRGMLDLLGPGEGSALMAHERAHLRLHHHRFLRVGQAAVAAVPVLSGVGRALRLATERWADEAAADEVGDRGVVARAIARAALAGGPPGPAPAFTGGAVSDRVQAMLRPPVRLPLRAGAAMLAPIGAVVASVALQGNHLLMTLGQLC